MRYAPLASFCTINLTPRRDVYFLAVSVVVASAPCIEFELAISVCLANEAGGTLR